MVFHRLVAIVHLSIDIFSSETNGLHITARSYQASHQHTAMVFLSSIIGYRSANVLMFARFIILILMISTNARSTNTRNDLYVSRLDHSNSDLYSVSVITINSLPICTKPATNIRLYSIRITITSKTLKNIDFKKIDASLATKFGVCCPLMRQIHQIPPLVT